jgi:hypothetical protein
MNNTRELVKMSWDSTRRLAQVWRRTFRLRDGRTIWSRAGVGFDLGRTAETWRAKEWRVEIVDHDVMAMATGASS